MNDNVKEYGMIFSNSHNRLIIGLIFVGLGGGLIASAFINIDKQ